MDVSIEMSSVVEPISEKLYNLCPSIVFVGNYIHNVNKTLTNASTTLTNASTSVCFAYRFRNTVCNAQVHQVSVVVERKIA